MFKRFSTTTFNAMSIAAAAFLALALGVGANSGIIGLSQFTPANTTVFCRDSRPLTGRQFVLIRSTLPEAFSRSTCNSDSPQDQSVESTQSKATGTTFINRRIFTGRF